MLFEVNGSNIIVLDVLSAKSDISRGVTKSIVLVGSLFVKEIWINSESFGESFRNVFDLIVIDTEGADENVLDEECSHESTSKGSFNVSELLPELTALIMKS